MKTDLGLVRITPEERRDRRALPPRAWWIPGNSASDWIAVIEELQLAAAGHELFPISRHDRKDGAILIAADANERRPRGAVPLHEFLPSLWIPSDARPSVAVGEADTAGWLIADYAVFFPDNTLLHLDVTKAIRLPDLIAPPVPNSRQWIATADAATFLPRVRSVSSYHTPSFEEIVEEAKDNIGTRDPKELGPKSALGKLGSGLGKAGKLGLAGPPALLLGGLLKLYTALPGGAASPTALDRLAAWAATKLEDLRRRQDSEMERLQKLFDEDPDKALEHAIPLGGEESRGVGGPSATLGWKEVDFSLGQLGGGGPSSPWEIDAHTWADLTRRYREAANREIDLGRHRRAAYILAHLLRDLPAAAEALKSGGFYRDAAGVYEKLERPRDVAACHVLAGDIDKAAAIYLQLPDYAALAGLYTKLDRLDDAEDAWQKEIDRLVGAHDVAGAARVLDEELRQPGEAIDLLAEAWPTPANLEAYLPYELKLRRIHRSPESYRDRLEALRESLPLSLAPQFARILLGETSRHPGDERTPWLADTIRLTASRAFTSQPESIKSGILQTLAALEPADQIHGNDARRFKRLAQPAAESVIQLPLRPGRKIEFTEAVLRHESSMATKLTSLLDVASCASGFVVVGVEGSTLKAIRYHPDHSAQLEHWTDIPNLGDGIQVSVRENPGVTLAHTTAHLGKSSQRVSGDMRGSGLPSFIATGLTDPTAVGACFGENGIWTCRLLEGTGFILDHQGSDGETRTYHLADTPPDLDLDLVASQKLSVPMAAFSKQVYLAFGSAVARFANKKFSWIQLPEPVRRIRKSPAHTKERILLLTDSRLFVGPVDRDFDSLISTDVPPRSDTCLLHNGLLATYVSSYGVAIRDAVTPESLAMALTLPVPLIRQFPESARIVRLPSRNGFALVLESKIAEYELK